MSRRSIVVTFDPLHTGSTKGRFQSLRTAGVVSPGVSRPRRRNHGRLSGTLHLYSELNSEAVRLFRRGELVTARAVAQGAAELEQHRDIQELVEKLAGMDTMPSFDQELAWADVQQLVNDTDLRGLLQSAALAAEVWRQQFESVFQALDSIRGTVAAIQNSLAVIETLRGSFAFPASQLRRLSLDHIGAAVELQWEEVQATGSLISLAAAIDIEDPAKTLPFSPYASSTPPKLPAHRWTRLRELVLSPGIEPPPLPIPLPSA